jgi:methionyl-tRNA synthetase
MNRVKEGNEKLNDTLKKNTLNRAERKELKTAGVNIKDRKAVKAYFEEKEKANALAEEQAKKASVKEKAENVATVAQIGIEDFAKVELTAAKILDCEAVPKAKKLLKLTLDDGNGTRTVASGIAKFYTPDELKGKTVILVSNLKPAKLCGIESQGMILAADCGEDVKVIFLEDVPAGSKIR